ncbi:MAG: DeoR family transcriptional regulator [candidate division Zixibacteria bacterium]|nr:DeoR family transcriptional regulator [candidate division Zixibacteria bacterium]
MNRKQRIALVREMLWANRQMSLEEIAKACGVSLRTTYRDLHVAYSRSVGQDQPAVAK